MRTMRVRLRLEEGWSTLALLWALLLVAAMAINQADLIEGLHIVPVVATAAVFSGLLLAKSRFSPGKANTYSLIYGLFIVLYMVGTTLPPEMVWRERVFDLMNRQVVWFGKAFQGGTSRDGLIFVIHTSAVFWVLGYSAAWYTFRTPRVWRAILPTGLVLLSVVYYYTGPGRLPLYLAVYILLAFIFVARTHLVMQEKMWRDAAVQYEESIWFSFLRAGFLLSLLALVVAWSIPAMPANAAVSDALVSTRGPWRRFQDNWTRLFSALRSYSADTSDPYQNTLVLGGPRNVGNTPIMDVYVPQAIPAVYWQAVGYDTYENGIWSIESGGDTTLHYPDDGVLQTPPSQAREAITQTVYSYIPNTSFLYAAPEVIGSDRQMFVNARPDGDGHSLVSSIRSRYILRQGDVYNVTSRVSVADAESLRAASRDYPDWVMDTYLQLPDTITPETIELAEQLTAAHDNPFDMAIAVRDYLRENITYNDQISAPPEGVDPVHYTLFDIKQGYCNYYASSMAVMLRSQGVPARIVSGYAQGDYDEDTGSYRVRASNAHTWAEVYFPNYGWIQFEPTASIPTVSRPESSGGGDAFETPLLPEEDPNVEDLPDSDPQSDFERGLQEDEEAAGPAGSVVRREFSIWQVLIGVAVLMFAALLLVLASEVNRRVESDVRRSYSRLGSWARRLGIRVHPTHTPHERADLMATAVPEGKTPIRNLTRQFVLQQFSRGRSYEAGFDPLEEWRVLRPILLRKTILQKLRQTPRRLPGRKPGR
ncbi:MAG: transglutaminase family protein [Anaerolineae bacterium]